MKRFLSLLLVLVVLCPATLALAEQETVLHFWNPEDSAEAIGMLDKMVATFEASHPGVKVELTTIPWGDIYSKWMTAIESGTTPDVSIASAAYARSLYAIGALAPITDVVPEGFFADSAKSFVNVHTAEDGELVGMPFVQNCVVLWYRKSSFEKQGLKVPETWEEMLDCAKQLTHDGKYGMLLTASRSHITQQCFYSLIAANGGEITDHETGTQNLFNSPENVETLKYYADLAQFTPPGSLGYERADAESAMATGLIDMFVYGSWLGGALLANAPEVYADFAVAPVPGHNGHRGSNMGNLDLVVFKNSPNTELAKEFVMFLMENENYLPWICSNPTSYLPVTKAAQESPDYTENANVIASKDIIDVVKQELPYAWVYGAPNPNAGQLEGLSTITYAVTRVLLEGMSAEDAMATTATEVGEVLGTN